MTKAIKTGKDTYLYVGPPMTPAELQGVVADGFESLGGNDPAAAPTAATLYARDNVICGLAEWSRHCKTTASIAQSAETADVSDDCNPDATIITKLTRSLTFNSFNRKGDGGRPIPGAATRRLDAAYKSEGCLLVPVLWLDCERTDDGARGIFMLANVTDFGFTGNLNDPVSFDGDRCSGCYSVP